MQKYSSAPSIFEAMRLRIFSHNSAENPDELVMVGNSFKSDIAPALKIGASAVHIPFHTTWAHEKPEEFEHPKLRRISRFEELLDIL